MNNKNTTARDARHHARPYCRPFKAHPSDRREIDQAIQRVVEEPPTCVRIVRSHYPDEIHWRECGACKRPADIDARDDTCRGCGKPTFHRSWRRPGLPPAGASRSAWDDLYGAHDEVVAPHPWRPLPDGEYRFVQGRILRRRN